VNRPLLKSSKASASSRSTTRLGTSVIAASSVRKLDIHTRKTAECVVVAKAGAVNRRVRCEHAAPRPAYLLSPMRFAFERELAARRDPAKAAFFPRFFPAGPET
jgi:hypothetical protein